MEGGGSGGGAEDKKVLPRPLPIGWGWELGLRVGVGGVWVEGEDLGVGVGVGLDGLGCFWESAFPTRQGWGWGLGLGWVGTIFLKSAPPTVPTFPQQLSLQLKSASTFVLAEFVLSCTVL